MAYTDTGLGWYADENWLMNVPGTIAELRSSAVITEAFNITVNSNGAYSDGVFHFRLNGDTSPSSFTMDPIRGIGITKVEFDFEYSLDGYGSGAYLLWPLNSYSSYPINQYCYFSDLIGCRDTAPTYCVYPADSPIGSGHCVVDFTKDSGEGKIQLVSFQYGGTLTISNVEITGSGDASIIFNKATAGYSIVCMCKWITTYGGDVYCSPILISSAENNTLYTRNSSLPSVPATQHEFQGMTFFMRKAPLDTLDGSETITSTFPVVDLSGVAQTNDTIFAAIAAQSLLGVGPVPEDDPYAGAGESGPDAGDPTFDFTSEDIPVPSIPSIGAFNTGFINMYKPTASDLRDLAHYLWSGSFDPENFKKLIANPMDAILGLHIVPATASHPTGSSATLYVGNIDTELSMQRLTEQYYELDCGTINIDPKWGAYLDYAPYSKLTLYLPYIGFVPISPDDCMGGSINVKYHVDVLSGACCVYVYCTSNRGEDSHVLYSYTGACACDCPVTEGQYTNAVLGILNIAGSVAGVITGALAGNAGGITGGIESAANAALSMVKPDISRSGSFGGSAGLMGIQYPYLVLTVPRMCTPGDQQKQEGYPSFVTKTMAQLVGYNQVQVKRLEGMSCTANETEEILALLEGGVIF